MNTAVLKLEEVEPLLAEFGRNHATIRKLEIFGSLAAGRANNESDLDVLVTFDEAAPDGLGYFLFFSEIQKELQQKVGRRVDLIDRGSLDGDLFSYNATRNVKAVYERR